MTIQSLTMQLLRIKQASEVLGVHPQTLRRWERLGRIKPVRIGLKNERRFTGEELEKLIKK